MEYEKIYQIGILDGYENNSFDVVIVDSTGVSFDGVKASVKNVFENIRLCLQIIKPDGLVYVVGHPEYIACVATWYPIDRQKWLVWHYENNEENENDRFWQRSHYAILCLWKPGNEKPKLEIDQIREPYTKAYMSNAGKTRKATPGRYTGEKQGKDTVYKAHEKGALPRDVIKVPLDEFEEVVETELKKGTLAGVSKPLIERLFKSRAKDDGEGLVVKKGASCLLVKT